MCLAAVYLEEGDGKRLVMDKVTSLDFDEGGNVIMVDLFGKRQIVEGTLRHVDLEGSEVIIAS